MDALVVWWYDWGALLLLFAVLAMLAVLAYDSQARQVKSSGWLLSASVAALLLLPSLILKFSDVNVQISMASQILPFFYLALVGSAASLILSIAGLAVNSQKPGATPRPGAGSDSPPGWNAAPDSGRGLEGAARSTVNAWLINRLDGRSYQLLTGDTRLGRHARNDIPLGHPSVSREHLLIREEGQCFTLFDRGSRSGTRINGQPVGGPVLLQHGDIITAGEVDLEFITHR